MKMQSGRMQCLKNGQREVHLLASLLRSKDNICISGQCVTAASKMLEGFVSPYDATVITHLREQGAVLVGTNKFR